VLTSLLMLPRTSLARGFVKFGPSAAPVACEGSGGKKIYGVS